MAYRRSGFGWLPVVFALAALGAGDTRLADAARVGDIAALDDLLKSGAFDQREVEQRDDVLVYSTPPLEEDVVVVGPVRVELWAASSAPDTDFTAKLVDVTWMATPRTSPRASSGHATETRTRCHRGSRPAPFTTT